VQAIILAGGLGTRLRSVVPDLPKPMADVGGRPFLDYLLRQLARGGFDDVILATGHRAEAIEQYFGRGGGHGMRLAYSREPQPLGTGGALKLAERHLAGDRIVVMNGDSFFDIPIRELVATHERSGATATLALSHRDEAGRYGSVELDAGGAVTGFAEKTASAAPGLVNGGVYVVERSVVAAMPAGVPVSLEHDVFPSLVGRGLHGVAFDGAFIDIGVPADLEALRTAPARLLGSLA
jgi:NDP-sugar pyrophosphorylase family protein